MQANMWNLMTTVRPVCIKRAINPTITALKHRYASTIDADVVVIGAGPGGYVAAKKAAELGMKTICVEKNSILGGTSLNPRNGDLVKRGVIVGDVKWDFEKLFKQKDSAVKQFTGRIASLFKKDEIQWIQGHGKITGKNEVSALRTDGSVETKINTKNILIATGSEVTPFGGTEIDEKTILSSTGVLSLNPVPKKMIVIGAGVIGLELGSSLQSRGSEVTAVEFMSSIGGAGIDGEVSKTMQKIMSKQGLNFKLGTKVIEVTKTSSGVSVKTEDAKNPNKKEILECDALLVCAGRRAYTDNLGIEDVGIQLDKKGRIPVNTRFQTILPNIFAIGDCIHGPMLAHKAEDQGIIAVEGIAGGDVLFDDKYRPSVIYTNPEIGWVGKTEEDLINEKIEYKIGKLPLVANSRTKINLETKGFCKVLACKDTDTILGVHMIGPNVAELIHGAVLAMEYGASAEDVARVCRVYQTCSKALREAPGGQSGKQSDQGRDHGGNSNEAKTKKGMSEEWKDAFFVGSIGGAILTIVHFIQSQISFAMKFQAEVDALKLSVEAYKKQIELVSLQIKELQLQGDPSSDQFKHLQLKIKDLEYSVQIKEEQIKKFTDK